MHALKIAACAAALALGFGVSAASAANDEMASVTTCLDRAAQVKTALDNNQQSANYHAAMQENMLGREYCNSGFYAKGDAHYDRALQILGAAQKS